MNVTDAELEMIYYGKGDTPDDALTIQKLVSEIRRLRAITAPAWMATPPTVAGWYWWQYKPESPLEIVEVKLRDGAAVVWHDGHEDYVVIGQRGYLVGGLWAGPLQPPPTPAPADAAREP